MDIQLNNPEIKGELMESIKNRHSSRNYSTSKDLTLQQISDLLWVSYGNNRKKENLEGHHHGTYKTVPSACAAYPLEIFAFMKTGVYKYDPDNNKLILIKEGDFREKSGTQQFVKDAFININMFFNVKKHTEFPNEGTKNWLKMNQHSLKMACMDCAYVSENIYLYCALHGINTVARAVCGNNDELKKLLGLSDDYEVLLAQSVGY